MEGHAGAPLLDLEVSEEEQAAPLWPAPSRPQRRSAWRPVAGSVAALLALGAVAAFAPSARRGAPGCAEGACRRTLHSLDATVSLKLGEPAPAPPPTPRAAPSSVPSAEVGAPPAPPPPSPPPPPAPAATTEAKTAGVSTTLLSEEVATTRADVTGAATAAAATTEAKTAGASTTLLSEEVATTQADVTGAATAAVVDEEPSPSASTAAPVVSTTNADVSPLPAVPTAAPMATSTAAEGDTTEVETARSSMTVSGEEVSTTEADASAVATETVLDDMSSPSASTGAPIDSPMASTTTVHESALPVATGGSATAIVGTSITNCSNGTGQTSFEMYMPYDDVNITVPAIDQNVTKYEYAGDNALVAIPAACYQKEEAFFGSASNFADRAPDGPNGMFYFRMSDPDTEYAKLANMTDCSSGLVVLLHGTSGVRWNPVSYAATLSGLGWVVVLPDSQSQPAEMGYKGAISLKNTSEIDTSNYCGAMDAYNETAKTWSKPFMYSTKVENVLNNGANYAEYMERNYRIRALEMDAFVSKRESLLSAFFTASRVFLLGRSEGGAVAGRYYNEALHSKLSGIILSGWSCEFNYFVSCAENALICEDKCSKDIPVLNVVGESDSYFASNSSVSADVAKSENGYGGPITGNCKATMDAQGFNGPVVVMEGGGHGFLYTHDNAWRSVLGDFLACPTATSLPSLQRPGCQEQSGVYTCDALSESPPCVDWAVNVSVPLAASTLGSCAVGTTSTADLHD